MRNREMVKKIDPVEEGNEQVEELLDPSSFTLDDFKAVPSSAAVQVNPFEGYPMEDIKLGERKVKGKMIDIVTKKTFVVALAPNFFVQQDPSGLGVTIKQLSGKDKGTDKMVDIKTSHNRTVVDSMGNNNDVVFDNIFVTANGKLRYAIVSDHRARSQLMYKINTKQEGRPIEVDHRYVFMDIKQKKRLREVFRSYYYQQTKSEKAATKFDEAKGDEEV